jgi:hypothetical protein
MVLEQPFSHMRKQLHHISYYKTPLNLNGCVLIQNIIVYIYIYILIHPTIFFSKIVKYVLFQIHNNKHLKMKIVKGV